MIYFFKLTFFLNLIFDNNDLNEDIINYHMQ